MFDTISYLVSHMEHHKNIPLENDIQCKLKSYFNKVEPWTEDLKQVLTRRFEIISLPIHLWSDEIITQVGQTIGEV